MALFRFLSAQAEMMATHGQRCHEELSRDYV